MRSATPVRLEPGFGWLHRDPSRPARETAVLLCPALNRDALDAQHEMRLLAEAFASQGFPALRFDYPGTGNAADLPRDADGWAEPWAPWLRSVHEAADFLLAATGAKNLIFCGLRFGGLIAGMAAADREDVAGLLLLEPVLRGQSYLLQLWIEAGLKDAAQGRLAKGFVFHELIFGPDAVRDIGQADLRRVRLAGKRVAVFSRAASRGLDACVTAWRADQAVVSCHGFAGLEPMLRHNLTEDPAAADFAGVLAWTDENFPGVATGASASEVRALSALALPGGTEELVLFGPGQRLAGVLCRPAAGGVRTAVLIANSGRDPQYGYARFGVELGRRLAAAGIASLRFDFAGLGESLGPPGREDEFSPLFELDRAPDIAAAAELLWNEGFHDLAAFGLCSGGYHMLHGALREHRLKSLMLINLPLFVWKPGETLDFALARHRALPLRVFLRGVARPESWRRFFTGALPAVAVLRGQAEKIWREVQKLPALLHARLGRGGPAATPVSIMAQLAARGVRALFMYAPDDTGLYEMELNFGKDAVRAARLPWAAVQVVAGLDHMLSTAPMRDAVTKLMIGFLRDNEPSPAAHEPVAAESLSV